MAQKPSFFVVLAGAWLLVAPLLLDHDIAGTALAAGNDVLVGALLVILAAIRLIRPVGTAVLSLVNVMLGVWLLAAPFVCGYDTAMGATLNDFIVGLIVVMLAGVSWLTGRLSRGVSMTADLKSFDQTADESTASQARRREGRIRR